MAPRIGTPQPTLPPVTSIAIVVIKKASTRNTRNRKSAVWAELSTPATDPRRSALPVGVRLLSCSSDARGLLLTDAKN